MPAKQNIYEVLLSRGIPKSVLDSILNYLIQQQRAAIKPSASKNFNQSVHHPWFLYHYYKNFRLVIRLRGAALSLLKSGFIKKPKNPV